MSDPTWNGSAWVLTEESATVTAPEAPTNSTATTDVPSNYLICDRSGFKVDVMTGLREEWNGLKVHPKFWEARHPQDFVRSKPEELNGSERPEQTDYFLSTNEVSSSDL